MICLFIELSCIELSCIELSCIELSLDWLVGAEVEEGEPEVVPFDVHRQIQQERASSLIQILV